MSFRSKSFHYNIHKMPSELNSRSYQLAYGKTGFVIRHFTAVPRNLLMTTIREDLLYLLGRIPVRLKVYEVLWEPER